MIVGLFISIVVALAVKVASIKQSLLMNAAKPAFLSGTTNKQQQ